MNLKSLVLGVGAFAGGAVLMTSIRAVLHQPYNHVSVEVTVSATATSACTQSSNPTMIPATSSMSGAKMAAVPVNTICAICGMAVDPALPTALYRGQVIGFGCRRCPPLFAAEPDVFGPYFLKNEEKP